MLEIGGHRYVVTSCCRLLLVLDFLIVIDAYLIEVVETN